jgi:NitT/TauT family transport system ATP-binding protein
MAFGVIRNVRKVFQLEEIGWTAREPVVALDDASFEFEEGELVALLGPSGCGKTTLLRIVGGLIPKSAGSVVIAGREVTKPMGDYGFVFQAPALMPWRNVLDNVLFPMEILKKNDAAARRHALELLQLVGLNGFLSARPHQLSGGMQQRVALCRALVHRPRLLLMDEPFGALDALTRAQLQIDLQNIWQSSRKTVVFVTHSIEEAVFLSDRIIVMTPRPGRVREVVEIDLARPRRLDVRDSPVFADAIRRVNHLFQDMGVIRG